MPRAIWSGSISFGLVNVPVKVHTAVRDHTLHFHQVDKSTGSRVRYEKVDDKTGKEVKPKDVELGYEVKKGQMVVVDPDELASLRPQTTKTIDITDFVDLAQIDPVFYNKTYWLAPDGEAAERAYGLLVAAMEDRGKVGIGTVVMRNKQYLAAIRPRDGALALSTMRFADEVLPAKTVGGALEKQQNKRGKPAAAELKLATQIIDSLAADWDPEQYRDTYTEEVQELIKRHAEGEDLVTEEKEEKPSNVTDLMEALQASLDAAADKKKSTGKTSSKGHSTRKSTAKKSA